jgi:hypothetical protein
MGFYLTGMLGNTIKTKSLMKVRLLEYIPGHVVLSQAFFSKCPTPK